LTIGGGNVDSFQSREHVLWVEGAILEWQGTWNAGGGGPLREGVCDREERRGRRRTGTGRRRRIGTGTGIGRGSGIGRGIGRFGFGFGTDLVMEKGMMDGDRHRHCADQSNQCEDEDDDRGGVHCQ